MDDWLAGVPAQTISRGLSYYESGLVRSLEQRRDGWYAKVSGSDDYQVFIPSSLDVFLARCTCPHYEDGNICKHIVATGFAVSEERGADAAHAPKDAGAEPTLDEIVKQANADDLRALIADLASRNESLRREILGTFGPTDAKHAKRQLQKTTTELIHRHERGGFIDWCESLDFEGDYHEAVESIMRPIIRSRDADALIDLVIPRYVQLQRISIDDSNGFFTNALADVSDHLDQAFELASPEQRRRLFDLLCDFLEDNPGKDEGDVYWFEQEHVEAFIIDRYSQDAAYAPDMLAYADSRLTQIPPAPEGAYDTNSYKRSQWATARLRAMSTLGTPAAELRGYAAEMGLFKSADVVRMLADAYVRESSPSEAIAILLENADAYEQGGSRRRGERPPRIVDCILRIAEETLDEDQLRDLYVALLHAQTGYNTTGDDVVGWYDKLRRLVGESSWAAMREELLGGISDRRACVCLAHEGSFDELYERIMANGGEELLTYERTLSGRYPEPYVNLYLTKAMSDMALARDRRGYRTVASSLSHAAGLPGGRDEAQKAASRLAAENPRKTAFLEELRAAGFEV